MLKTLAKLAKYGITEQVYERMKREQKNVCAICGNPPKTRALHIDHNHKTGAVRGLLCFHCNYALGRFRDNPARLKAAAAYLERNVDWRLDIRPKDRQVGIKGTVKF